MTQSHVASKTTCPLNRSQMLCIGHKGWKKNHRALILCWNYICVRCLNISIKYMVASNQILTIIYDCSMLFIWMLLFLFTNILEFQCCIAKSAKITHEKLNIYVLLWSLSVLSIVEINHVETQYKFLSDLPIHLWFLWKKTNFSSNTQQANKFLFFSTFYKLKGQTNH